MGQRLHALGRGSAGGGRRHPDPHQHLRHEPQRRHLGPIQAARIVPSASHFNFISGFSRFNYNFRQKYFLEASVRTDGSSRFGPGNRYGTVGNAELPNDFLYLSDANLNWADLQYGGFQGAGFNRIGNRDLRWEATTEGNLGLDFGFLNGRINGMINVYDTVSDGLLLETQLANRTGYIERGYVVNVGKVRNSGVEFSINTVNLERGDFRWTSNFNISRNYNKTLALTPPVDAQDTRAKTLDAGSTRLIEGGVVGAYFLPIWAGVDPVTGNELIYALDQLHLNQTGLTRLTGNVLDATLLGGGTNNHPRVIEDKSPHPTFFGGLSTTLVYKGLDFTFLFYFQAGNWILDEGERSQSYPASSRACGPACGRP